MLIFDLVSNVNICIFSTYIILFHLTVSGRLLVVSVSTAHVVCRGFASQPGHTINKDHLNVQAASLFGTQPFGKEFDSADCLKGLVVCGTVYGDMHLKDLCGSIARVGYCIPVPDFYLVLHDLRCRKSTIID